MVSILVVHSDKNTLSSLIEEFEKNDSIQIKRKDSGRKAFELLAHKKYDIVVVDEELCDMSGFDFIKKVVTVNPLINSAVISSLSHKEYHRASEGLGILMQLPPNPDGEKALLLLQQLKKVMK